MSDADRMGERKCALRARVRAARRAIGSNARRGLSAAACRRLLALPELCSAGVVLAYAASDEEIDPAPALEALRARGATVVLPRVEPAGLLSLHAVAGADPLEPGAFGIREPASHLPLVLAETIDAVIVPGVAFDERGVRLGYGGGHYDRLLPRMRADCLLVGLAFDEQLVDQVPAEEHDVRLDVVVTPSRTFVPDTRSA